MEFEEEGYVPISERPEWQQNFTPLPQPPSSLEVVAIQSDQIHADLLAYFWAAMNAQERSHRVLALTEEIILFYNSAHFSVWAWRWECLLALEILNTAAGGAAEAALQRRVATANPPNYQLWNLRRKFAMVRGAEHVDDELQFCAACLTYDAKNYHAWAHRQAIIKVFAGGKPGLWEQELAYTERLLREDIRNNSAWNQRYVVLQNICETGHLGTGKEIYDREVDFVVVKIEVAPHNEAAWGYLTALVSGGGGGGIAGVPVVALGFEERVKKVCRAVLQADNSNACALELLAEFYSARAAVLARTVQSPSSAAAAAAVDKDTHDDNENDSSLHQKRKVAFDTAVEAATELFSKLLVARPSRAAFYKKRLTDVVALSSSSS